METRRDEQLLADHLAGVAGAFDQLVARYADELYSFFVRFVGHRTAAEDLVQDTFLQVHLAAGSFDPGRAFKPWLYTIAANKGRDYMRSRGRRPVQSLDAVIGESEGPAHAAQVESPEAAAPQHMATEELRAQVRAVIGRLPENLQLILLLGHYQRLPYAEIAEILGIPVGTVKSRLHAAVTQFTRLWQAAANGEPPAA